MKKIIYFLLISTLLVQFSSCGSEETSATKKPAQSTIGIFDDDKTENTPNENNNNSGTVPEQKGSEGLEYEKISDAYYVVTGIGTCKDKDIIIPGYYDGLQVKEIADLAFHDEEITSVMILDGVERLGMNAFSSCEDLTNVSIPNTVSLIDKNAFYYCTSLTSISIPDSVTLIEEYVFWDCTSLKAVALPTTIKKISAGTFKNCDALTDIRLPYGLEVIETRAFEGCDSLETITIPTTVTEIAGHAFHACEALKTITIPESVVRVGASTFHNCGALESIVFEHTSGWRLKTTYRDETYELDDPAANVEIFDDDSAVVWITRE